MSKNLEGEEFNLRYLSLGVGVQSTALLVMANEGLLGEVDYAIFSDTGAEPKYVHDYLKRLKEWSKIEILVVQEKEGLVEQSYKGGYTNIPVFMTGLKDDGKRAGMLNRQCTAQYKIKPLNDKVKRLCGIGYRKRAKGVIKVECLVGISMDEAQRMKPSFHSWITNSFPLCEALIHRHDCYKIIEDAGLPVPFKSSCYHCPFHSDATWIELKKNDPKSFQKAVEYDLWVRKIRENKRFYLHRSLKPLGEVDFSESAGLFDDEVDMFGNECEGMCGV